LLIVLLLFYFNTKFLFHKCCTVLDGKLVIPLFMDHRESLKYVADGGSKLNVGYIQFPYNLGGVRTGHKIQGATRPRLTCNFNPRPDGVTTHLDLRSLFVSVSRVNSIDNIRIVPLINGDRSKLDYMRKFSMDPRVRLLQRCYNERGEWVATTNDIVKWFDELGIEWRPKSTKKHPLNDSQIAINERYPRPSAVNGNKEGKKRISSYNDLTPNKKQRYIRADLTSRKRSLLDFQSSQSSTSSSGSSSQQVLCDVHFIDDSTSTTPQRTSHSFKVPSVNNTLFN